MLTYTSIYSAFPNKKQWARDIFSCNLYHINDKIRSRKHKINEHLDAEKNIVRQKYDEVSMANKRDRSRTKSGHSKYSKPTVIKLHNKKTEARKN
jgi:hypothetical protein